MELYNQRILLKYVSDLQLSTKVINLFTLERIIYLGDLVQKTEDEILRFPNIGKKSLNELKQILAKKNLSLGMKISDWNEENVNKLVSEIYPRKNNEISRDEIEHRFFMEMSGNFSSMVCVKDLRKMKLEEHQQIIDNYCKYSKSPFKHRNILIYDIIILQGKKSKEATEELGVKNPIHKIKAIIDKGFYKDLLKYWELNLTRFGFVKYSWKK